MFSGLSAFPLTPMNESSIDESAFLRLISNLVAHKVDSIGVLGSTGSYAYLSIQERMRIAKIAIEQAQEVPVIVGIGAMRTRDVLTLAEDAQKAGADALLLAPVSYQKLSDDEVFILYETVTRFLSIPLCVYDNPATTHFIFSDELHVRIAQLPKIGSIKLPPLPADPQAARLKIEQLRQRIPAHVSLGISGDAFALQGLQAGCDAWYSVIAGLFPVATQKIIDAFKAQNTDEARRLSEHLEPLWAMFKQYGSIRVVATSAELLGLVEHPCLPLPIHSLGGKAREKLEGILKTLQLM
ncbi:MAG TPA: dihydrodipicolinate synthase family protein [Methylophilaceae bacterium]|jgi:4-hydroxy-tetrahydrodipicolinate synthase